MAEKRRREQHNKKVIEGIAEDGKRRRTITRNGKEEIAEEGKEVEVDNKQKTKNGKMRKMYTQIGSIGSCLLRL